MECERALDIQIPGASRYERVLACPVYVVPLVLSRTSVCVYVCVSFAPWSAQCAPCGVGRLQRRPPGGVHAVPEAVRQRGRRVETRDKVANPQHVPDREVLVEGRCRGEHLPANHTLQSTPLPSLHAGNPTASPQHGGRTEHGSSMAACAEASQPTAKCSSARGWQTHKLRHEQRRVSRVHCVAFVPAA